MLVNYKRGREERIAVCLDPDPSVTLQPESVITVAPPSSIRSVEVHSSGVVDGGQSICLLVRHEGLDDLGAVPLAQAGRSQPVLVVADRRDDPRHLWQGPDLDVAQEVVRAPTRLGQGVPGGPPTRFLLRRDADTGVVEGVLP